MGTTQNNKIYPIVSVGVEVECGITEDGINWLRSIEEQDKRVEIGTDGSVYVDGFFIKDCEVRFYSENIEELKNFLMQLWEYIEQNETCGNHIHIKINSEKLNLFTFFSFVEFFQENYKNKYKEKTKYLRRLTNQYSKEIRNKRILLAQLNDESGTRYYAINLKSLNEHQQTIEFRIMPYASNFNEHWEQIQFVINTVKKFYRMMKNFILSEEEIKNDKTMFIKTIYKIGDNKLCVEY